MVESIVTRARVEKELYKMRDEGLLPQEKGQWEVKTINRYLPKRIYEDCVKEEKEKVEEAGKLFGHLCAATTFKHVTDLLFGGYAGRGGSGKRFSKIFLNIRRNTTSCPRRGRSITAGRSP